MELGPLGVSQLILDTNNYSSWFSDGKADGELGIAGCQLFPDLAIEIVFEYEMSSSSWRTPYFDFYGVLPNHDWDNSFWYWLGPGNNQMRGRAPNQVSYLLGPGTVDWDAAVAAGETGLMVDVYGGGVITGMAWRYVPMTGPVGGLTPGAAPALELGVVTEATLQGTSPGPGVRYWDEETAGGVNLEQNARWWKFTPDESGWYEYDVASMSGNEGGTAWTWSAAYWFQGVPSENEMPIAHSNYDHAKGEDEAYGLVELTAGVTYYLRVTSRPSYGANPKWRLRVERAAWFCGHAGPDHLQAKEIGNVDGFCSDPIPNYGFPSHWYYATAHTAWWTFVAPRSGPFKISATLTQKDGVRVNQWWMYARLFTNDPYWTGVNNPLWIEDINQFPGDEDEESYYWDWIEEGRRYWIAVMPYYNDYDGPLDYVLQTQYLDHAVVELENEIVFARSDGSIAPVPPLQPADSLDMTIDPQSFGWTGVQSGGFQGYMEFWRSFGGPQPGSAEEINNTWTCMWPKARKGQGGTWWWSKNNGVSWNGTDPYNGSIPGYGNCPTYTPGPGASEQSYSDAPVGWHYHSEGWTYGQNYVRVWCHAQMFGLHVTARRLGSWAGLSNTQISSKIAQLIPGGRAEGFMAYYDRSYLPPGSEYGDDRFNSAGIQRVQVAADEQTNQWANPGLAPPTEWYVMKSRQSLTGSYDAFPGWGPWTQELDYDLRFSGGPEGAESIAASAELVATYSGGTQSWQDIDWQEYWDYEEQLMGKYAADYINARGMMFVAMNAHHKSNAAPPTPPAMAGWDGPTINHYVARLGQVLCIKVKAKSQPVLVTSHVPFSGSPGPRLPECGWEWPQSSIDGDYEAGGREFTRVP